MVKRPDVSERNRRYPIPKIEINKDFLEYEYLINKKSARKIAKELNVSNSCINNRLKYFNIPMRTLSTMQIGELNPMYGKKRSIEHTNKIRAKLLKDSTVNKLEGFELGYVVAIIEGEGHFSLIQQNTREGIKVNRFSPVIGVTNLDLGLLRYVQNIIGAGNINTTMQPNGKIKGTLVIQSIKNSYDLVCQLIPYLFNKKQKAIKLKEYCEFLLEGTKKKEDLINNNELNRVQEVKETIWE